jgi:hypothetical protein
MTPDFYAARKPLCVSAFNHVLTQATEVFYRNILALMSTPTKKRDSRGYLQPNRRNRRKVGAYFGREVTAAMREVALRAGVQVQHAVAEAYRDVMLKHGVTPPAELDQHIVSGAREVKPARASIRRRSQAPKGKYKHGAGRVRPDR